MVSCFNYTISTLTPSNTTDGKLAGITIFDITDLSNVRYCFVDFIGMESEREVELLTPLSARTYLEAYYQLDGSGDDPNGLIPLVESFRGKDLVTVSALKDTWPHGKWQEGKEIEEEADSFAKDMAGPTDDTKLAEHATAVPAAADAAVATGAASTSSVGTGSKMPSGNPPKGTTKSLRDQSIDAVLNLILEQAQENCHQQSSDLVAEAELLIDFVPKLRLRLYDRAATLTPSASVLRLLHKALEQDIEVDLSPFQTLTMEHLSNLVAGLRGGKMRTLNLSNMPDLGDSDLESILGIGPALPAQAGSTSSSSPSAAAVEISNIILLENPKVSVDFLTKNLGHCDIAHSELLRRPFLTKRRDPYSETPEQVLHFDASNIASQLVWVGVSSMQSCDSKFRLENGQMDWKGLQYSVQACSRFSENSTLEYKNFLLDVPLPAGKMIHSLRRLLQYLSSPNLSWFEDWPKGAAGCFATTSILEEDGVGYSVGPLSTTLYRDDSRETLVESGKGRSLKPGQWAIILVHEAFDAKDQESLDKRQIDILSRFGPRGTEEMKEWPTEDNKGPAFKPQKRLRYALTKALPTRSEASEPQFLVTDVPGYVRHVVGGGEEGKAAAGEVEVTRMNDWWKKGNATFEINGNGYYDDDDVHEILRKVYASEPSGGVADPKPRAVDPFEDIMRMMTLAQRQM